VTNLSDNEPSKFQYVFDLPDLCTKSFPFPLIITPSCNFASFFASETLWSRFRRMRRNLDKQRQRILRSKLVNLDILPSICSETDAERVEVAIQFNFLPDRQL
jgi:hypothetical protein